MGTGIITTEIIIKIILSILFLLCLISLLRLSKEPNYKFHSHYLYRSGVVISTFYKSGIGQKYLEYYRCNGKFGIDYFNFYKAKKSVR